MASAKAKLFDSTSPLYTSPDSSSPHEKHPTPKNKNNYEIATQEPNDSYRLVYIVSVILGIGTLLGYNVLVTSADYFLVEYPDYSIVFWMIPAYSGPNFLFAFVVIAYGDIFSFTTRLLIVFTATAISIFLVPIISQSSSLSESLSYILILLICGFVGISTATLQATTLSFCGLLPLEYTRANISGQSLVGILSCIIRISTKLFEPDTDEGYIEGGLIYFIIGGIVDIICAISFLLVLRSIFVKHHLKGYFKRRKRIAAKKKKNNNIKNNRNNTTDDNIDNAVRNVLIREDTQHVLARVAEQETYGDVLAIEREPSRIGNNNNDFDLLNSSPTPPIAGSPKKNRNVFPKPKSLDNNNNNNNRMSNEALMAQLYGREDNIGMSPSMSRSLAGASDRSSNDHPNMMNGNNNNKSQEYQKLANNKNRHNRQESTYHLTTKTHALSEESVSHKKADFKIVFVKIRLAILSCFFSFFVTFLIFPGLLTGIESEYNTINKGDWMPVILITEFNLGDYFGRQFLSSWTNMGFTVNTLWIGAIWRILIYPIWLMLYIGEIKSDIIAHISTIILSVTNGHMCCLSFMYPPQLVEQYEMDTASSLMSFAAVTGIVLGSYIALGLSYVL